MKIDEAIKSERIKVEDLKEHIHSPEPGIKASMCLEMAEYHEQIIEWLEELKKYRDNARELKKTIDSSPCLKEILQKFQEYGERKGAEE